MERRSHTCGQLDSGQIEQAVTLMGWVRTYRDHGSLIFFDLWDREGTLQIVVDPNHSPGAHEVARHLRQEYVVKVSGLVRARPAGTENPALRSGGLEVLAHEVAVLNSSDPPPFPLETRATVDEAVRLRYRYLDLRRNAMQANLMLRHKVVKAIRDFLDACGFLEVETPVLTRSTPEGARDYLVPSRLHPGSFYALPQSPQQMKQLLMVAGVDKYFQMARCFRDEDLRADRQPEFTQLDIEMSFIEQEDVLQLVEELLVGVVTSCAGKRLRQQPFPRLTYAEAMERYGTDKPDLRFDLPILDVTDALANSTFNILRRELDAGSAVRGIAIPVAYAPSPKQISRWEVMLKEFGGAGLIWFAIGSEGIRSRFEKFFSEAERSALADRLGAKEGDVLLLSAGQQAQVASALGKLRVEIAKDLDLIASDQLAFAWITDFPWFKWSDEDARWVAEHHPFTAPHDDDLAHLAQGSETLVRSKAYDIVLNGYELGSGSIRIHQAELQQRMFEFMGLSAGEIGQQFGHLLHAFRFGTPPHGGIALGVDRLVMILAGATSIREVIAFPKNKAAVDLMFDAPSQAAPHQLDALHIGVKASAADGTEGVARQTTS